MASVKHAISELDVVELLDPIEGWPAGTSGTVVDERGEMKLIEIADERGVALDYVSVHEPQLKLVVKHGA